MAAIKNLESLRQYGINPMDVLCINGQPWLNSEQLCAIARQSGKFNLIDVDFVGVKENQIVYKAVVAIDDKTFGRPGVATVNERLPNGEIADAHELAASRALRSALAMAGFDVMKPHSALRVVESNDAQATVTHTRLQQIRRLHALAIEKGLIVGNDRVSYRVWLLEEFGVESSANFTEEQFELAINRLRNLGNR